MVYVGKVKGEGFLEGFAVAFFFVVVVRPGPLACTSREDSCLLSSFRVRIGAAACCCCCACLFGAYVRTCCVVADGDTLGFIFPYAEREIESRRASLL